MSESLDTSPATPARSGPRQTPVVGAELAALGRALQATVTALRDVSNTLERLGALLERQTEPPASGAEPSSEPELQPDAAAVAVTEFLASRYIEVVNIARKRVECDTWLQLARHIASTYPLTRPLLDAIKKTQGSGRRIVLPLGGMAQQQIAAITSLGALSSRAQLLPAYHYQRSGGRTVFCQPPLAPEAINFFVGGWLELWAHDTVARALGAPASGWHVCSGIQIRLANGEQAELDVLAVHGDGGALWLEAKTGRAFAEHLPKYRRLGARLAVEGALLLACDLPAAPETVRTLAGMTPCTIDEVARTVASLAHRRAAPRAATGPKLHETPHPGPLHAVHDEGVAACA